MKHYLIDSENVGDFWIPLLDLPAEETELVVFYTKNSPHMSYDSLIKLKQSDRTVIFIRCYEGTNALDFQLCSELGYRIAQNEDDDFIIVTNDTGYDAAVKYWRHKEYSVKRIAGKDTRTGSRRRASTGRCDVTAEVNALLHDQRTETVLPQEDLSDLDEEPVQAQNDLPEEVTAEEESYMIPDAAETESVTDMPEADEEAEGPQEETDADREEEIDTDPEEEAAAETETANDTDPDAGLTEDEEETSDADAAEEAAAETDVEAAAVSEAEPVGEAVAEADEESAEEAAAEAGTDPEVETPAEAEEENSADLAAEEETGRDAEEPDREEITAIVSCIAADNLAELHNQLIQFYGDDGKEIYQQIKSGAFKVERQNWNREEKFLYYSALIFRHSSETQEELSEENIREFAQFMLSAENKRKNLNSLRYALLKHYGKEKGRKYYFLVKPYVKAFNQM